jgi:toxin ParE1/3/4
MKPVTIDREAEAELVESVAFYESRSAGLGLEFEAAARAAVKRIQDAPEMYPVQKNGARRFVMNRFPFIIHYVDLPDSIWIVAFANTSRKPGYWLKRL